VVDKISRSQRSANMRAIRSENTKPELAVRWALREAGYTGYRLHRKDLPGRPDIAFIGRKKAIFVHGCFWHGHECREGMRKPKSQAGYWGPKIAKNRARDALHLLRYQRMGWQVLTIWDCETDSQGLPNRLSSFLAQP
jgi:DNA mismatch endonuclease (patch repair protein)